jgi:ribosomal protein S18 acetylase RimI-like enzyme
MGSTELRFRTIDLERHAELCIAFRRDSYVCSFGDDRRFEEENGPGGDGYLSWLRERIATYPVGHVHLWQGDTIAGQIEMSIREAGSAYVNLFYLAPAARGTGLGDALHAYAVELLLRERVETAHLSVSPSNARALRYYTKHGWRDLGAISQHPEVNWMRWSAPASSPHASPAEPKQRLRPE